MEAKLLLFLVVAFATHAVVAYALVRGFTDADPRLSVVFGLLPDVDLCFPAVWGWPLIHRGITHTPLFALTLVTAGYILSRDRTISLAIGLAIGSHLAIDSLSPMGIDWLFPFMTTAGPGLPVHGTVATMVLWTASISILTLRTDDWPPIRYRGLGPGSSLRRQDDRRGPSDHQGHQRE